MKQKVNSSNVNAEFGAVNCKSFSLNTLHTVVTQWPRLGTEEIRRFMRPVASLGLVSPGNGSGSEWE